METGQTRAVVPAKRLRLSVPVAMWVLVVGLVITAVGWRLVDEAITRGRKAAGIEEVRSELWGITMVVGIVGTLTLSGMVYVFSLHEKRDREKTMQLARKLWLYKRAFDSAFNHLIITDAEGKILLANRSVERITGYSQAEIIGNNPRLWGGQMDKKFYEQMWHRIKFEKLPFSGQVKNKRKNGEIYVAVMTISPILDSRSEVIGFVGAEEDISDLIRAQQGLKSETSELERMNRLMVGRELKMAELKKELARVKASGVA